REDAREAQAVLRHRIEHRIRAVDDDAPSAFVRAINGEQELVELQLREEDAERTWRRRGDRARDAYGREQDGLRLAELPRFGDAPRGERGGGAEPVFTSQVGVEAAFDRLCLEADDSGGFGDDGRAIERRAFGQRTTYLAGPREHDAAELGGVVRRLGLECARIG